MAPVIRGSSTKTQAATAYLWNHMWVPRYCTEVDIYRTARETKNTTWHRILFCIYVRRVHRRRALKKNGRHRTISIAATICLYNRRKKEAVMRDGHLVCTSLSSSSSPAAAAAAAAAGLTDHSILSCHVRRRRRRLIPSPQRQHWDAWAPDWRPQPNSLLPAMGVKTLEKEILTTFKNMTKRLPSVSVA